MRKLLHIFLSIFIVYATTVSAYATTSIGGWTATDTIISGANTTINAIKNGANGALKSAVTVAPSASKLGKFLIKGGGTAALLLAVPQLIGEGVDWVLDPANNTIKYKVPASPSDANYGDMICRYYVNGGGIAPVSQVINECSAWTSSNNFDGFCSYESSSKTVVHNTRGAISDQCYSPSGSTVTNPTHVDKSIPIDTVAAQVISNAASGEPNSQEAVKAVALEGFAAGEHDAALDASAIPDTGVENPPDTTNPDTPSDSVPFDPSSIIAAINAVKAMLAGIFSAVIGLSDTLTGFFDWVKAQWSEFVLTFGALNDWLFEETPPTDTDNTITPSVPPVVPVQVAIDFVGGCPAPLGFDFNFYGRSYHPAIPFTPICDVAILINPIIKICATIAAAYIVAGIRQGSN